MKKISLGFLVLCSTLLLAASGDRYYENATSNGDIIFQVNKGGVKTEAMRSKGSTAQQLFTDGTAAVPSLGLLNSSTTGLYRAGANILGFSSNATNSGQIAADGSWTIGPTAGGASHQVWGSSFACGSVGVPCTMTAQSTSIAGIFGGGSTNSTDAMRIKKSGATTSTAQVFVLFQVSNGGANSGYITANGADAATFTSTSDIRLKKNVINLPSQLPLITKMRPVEFDYKNGSGHQIGFIAQEVKEIYPDTVAKNKDGYYMLAGWSKTDARLVKALQELATENDELKSRLQAIEEQLGIK